MTDIRAVDEQTFDAVVLASDKPVLVEFWAEWCGPCRVLSPILAELARERAADFDVVKLNADHNPVVSARYRVMGLPTMILFHHGEAVWSVAGSRSKAQLNRELEAALTALPVS